MTATVDAAARRASRGRRHPAPLLLPLLALLLLLGTTTDAAAKAPTTIPPITTTRLRGATYHNADAPFERDHALLPAVFPTLPQHAGPIVVPCFVSRSHSTPYLEVVRHLAARGYRVVLLTDVRNVKWIRSLYGGDGSSNGPFEVVVAPETTTEPTWERLSSSLEKTIEDPNAARVLAKFIAQFGVAQTRELFPWVRDYLMAMSPRPSVVVADLMCEWIADSAELAGARLVMTTSGVFPGMADASWSLPITSDYPAATLEHAPLLARIWSVAFEPFDVLAAMLPVSRDLNRARAEVGLPPINGPPLERVAGHLHLINSFVGFEIARPIPSHIRMIGPVRSDGNSTLSGEWREFVEGLVERSGAGEAQRRPPRLVYAAFGQNAILLPDRLRGLMRAFKDLLAEGSIDGAVWSLSMTPAAYLEEAGFNDPGAVPPQIRLSTWAPQKALLAHHAVRVFISHGGAESCGEAFYSATPVLFVPHLADQPSNSYRLKESGMALVLRKEELVESEKVAAALRRLMSEPSFAASAARMRALALSKARLSAEAAADEIEYILHYGDDYLADPSSRMSFVKRHNVDVWGVVGFGLLVVVLVVVAAARRLLALVLERGGSGGMVCSGGVCKLPPSAKKVE